MNKNARMVIEIRGAEFVNKGAELMLHTTMDKISENYPGAIFVKENRPRSPIKKHKEFGLYTKFRFRFDSMNRISNPLFELIPAGILKKVSCIKEKDVNVVLDASGFAFGDKWGAKKAGNRLANQITKWKTIQKKKIILLPQAFGPFTEKQLKNKMKTIIDFSDLIFARDEVSYNHLISLDVKNKDNIELKPDFTNLIKGKVPEYFNSETHQFGIIPNYKMLDQTEEDVKNNYQDFLRDAVLLSKDFGMSPFFLIHDEGKKDLTIAKKVNSLLESPIPIIVEEDPILVKGMIGASKAILTSRFHGLVSALSQSVPCLSTSWSHKYKMLLKDYEYEEGLLEVSNTKDLKNKLDMVLDDENAQKIRARLEIKSAEQKRLTVEMWDKVFKIIDN